ncbi:hypothetical protein M422DRAFT_73763 [Sphaerobolus stellatus SS14]|nr:hypothetical protein M422DRAFT_73763 [Sphaerobolus stellatus SS14]
MQAENKYPKPKNGASLLLSFRLKSKSVVIIGSGKLAASRAFSCLEADSEVVVLGRGGLENACEEIKWRVNQGEVTWRSIEEEAKLWDAQNDNADIDEDETALESVLSSLPSVIIVCITDTIIPSGGNAILNQRSKASAARLYDIASRRHRIPTNITDMPALCDFSFPSTHRFRSPATDELTPLQIGIVTNTKGCRLASRITREIVARLPRRIGDTVHNVGRLRDMAKADEVIEQSNPPPSKAPGYFPENCLDGDSDLPTTPNEPVPQSPLNSPPGVPHGQLLETPLDRTRRRMRWVAQVSEYWPLDSLATLDNEQIQGILSGKTSAMLPKANLSGKGEQDGEPISSAPMLHAITPLPSPPPRLRGRILLLGSGPGHPSLLTAGTATYLRKADLVLSDKLVPEGVLKTIPEHVEVRIARKFPGNADRAQQELSEAAVEGAKQGKLVVRLKQGDPMLYARCSSEIEYFTEHGFPPAVVPGLSSALAAPLSAGIPVTARGVADSIAICTGVTKGGKAGRIPLYERATTLLILMGVARLKEMTEMMTRIGYPEYLPVCIIERGTMPDQRVIRSTMRSIVKSMADPRVGAQRPPGMMVVGWACLGVAKGVEGVSEDEGKGLKERDEERVTKWLKGQTFTVKEGLDESWEDL